MSLFGTIQQSAGALQVAQIGLQVVGNNIANVNTPGYLRQQLEQASALAVRDGGLIKGHGVRATGIVQIVDDQIAERMFNARTALAGAETLEKAYSQLEELTKDLDNNGLNLQLTEFNNSLHELSTQPSDRSLRDFVVLQADRLATTIRSSREDALSRRELWNGDLDQMAGDINRLLERIAKLNLDIATVEGGGLIRSDATGLRDQRLRDLEELSKFTNLNIQEQESGAVSVFVGGDYLISNGNFREVKTAYNAKLGGSEIRITETDSPLQSTSGVVAATMEARDGVFSQHIESLNRMASALIQSVNKVHSQGQGRTGIDELLSSVVADTGVPLTEAGLAFDPKNGSFDISILDEQGELLSTHRINVKMLGLVSDSTVQSIVADIDAIDGVRATVTSSGQVKIESEAGTSTFVFGEDTSGFIAAAGINTLFVGDDAFDIAVNPKILENSDFLNISRGGVGEDTNVLADLVDLIDKPFKEFGGTSVRGIYERGIANLGQKISLQSSTSEGLRNFYATLQSQHLAISGVNIDEESIKLISYQRAFQASSRVIATASEMLELLVNL